ncbi:hypothetical protein [Aquimarina agarivorans]|uniref:hypothetical protein n=1 Tax=Aquimarina agarivorans TaxID=980584 RepID=UPI000248EC43|nr:hypothetical protein [Aquimarina agarivorans]
MTESDIYWVSTSKLFKPFVYKPVYSYSIKNGSRFEISLPENYFKNVNNTPLAIKLKNKFDWLKFDAKKMEIFGLANIIGDFELTFMATDKFSNISESKIILNVSK